MRKTDGKTGSEDALDMGGEGGTAPLLPVCVTVQRVALFSEKRY